MAGFRLTPEAASDLFEIWAHIAADNPRAADRVEAAVYGIIGDGRDRPPRGE
jgi:plasmid stabilization system protein ParE